MSGLSDAAKAAWEHVLSTAGDHVKSNEPQGYKELARLGLLFAEPVNGDWHGFRLTREGRVRRHQELLTGEDASHAANEREVRAAVGEDRSYYDALQPMRDVAKREGA